MYLKNKNVKLFLNASIFYLNNFNTELTLGGNSFSLDMRNTINFALGLGCKYKERFSLEVRHIPKTDFLLREVEDTGVTGFLSFSLILGYSFF